MKRSGLILFATVSVGVVAARAADATTPVDYTDRNTTFAPSGTVTPKKRTPETNTTVQDKRIEKTTVEKQTSTLGDKRAAIDVTETREKQVREKESRRPEAVEQPKSEFNHRTAAISTSENTVKPPTVAKYQDSLTAASTSNMARFPAIGAATSAKINRFVFRKNPSESSTVGDNPVTPAAGGSPVQK